MQLPSKSVPAGEKTVNNKRQEQQELSEQIKNRNNNSPKVVGKVVKKDRENFETWKLKWNNFLISSNINSIYRAVVKEEQTKAALIAALSDSEVAERTSFWPGQTPEGRVHHQEDRQIHQGTTNLYAQVVELIEQKKSLKLPSLCDRRLPKGQTVHSQQGYKHDGLVHYHIVVANHDDVEVWKKLLLEKDLKLDMAKVICKEKEKAVKMSRMLGANSTSGKAGAS